MTASSAENFISFNRTVTEKVEARFIDFCHFLFSSIDSLVKNFEKEKDTALLQIQSVYRGEQFELATHEYITNQLMYEERQLPSREKFFCTLTGGDSIRG